MNEYLKKIKEMAKKYVNRIKANSLKNKILKGQMEDKKEFGMEDSPIDIEIISLVLQDKEVINKLYQDKTLLYYVSLLNEHEQLNFLNNNIDMFDEKELNEIYAFALKNIGMEELLKTELGLKVIEAFPKECYKEISELGEDKLKEINEQSFMNISLTDIASKIFENRTIKELLNDADITIEDKIAILKNKNYSFSMSFILESSISDDDKIELINNLNVDSILFIENCIFFNKPLNMSDELKSCILDKIPESEYIAIFNNIFSDKKEPIDYKDIEKTKYIIKIFGKERIAQYINSEQMKTYAFLSELCNNFDDEQIKALFPSYGYIPGFLEMNFIEKYPFLKTEGSNEYYLKKIFDEDKELFSFKKYYEFRDKNNDLDFCESFYVCLYEYEKYGSLYKEIIKNFHEFSDEEKACFKDRWNDLVALKNKFEIKTIEDFKRMDEIEKEYYSKIINKSDSPLELKVAIFEILVRDCNINKIVKLGNGTEYSMENKALEDVVDLLSTIDEITDQEALRNILIDCVEMIGSKELKNIRTIGRNIEEKIAHEYRKGYTNSFTRYEEMTDEELAQIEGLSVQRIKGVRIIELKGAPFAFLSHTGDILGGSERCCCTEITDENFNVFGKGLEAQTHIYTNVDPHRIKYINLSDSGTKKYQNTYISATDIPSSTQSSSLGTYNEVTLSTGTEKNSDELISTATMTNNKVYSNGFNAILNDIENDSSKPKTLFVIHEDIYNEKNKQNLQKREELLKTYMRNLDPKLLNLLLRSTGGNQEEMTLLLEEIKRNIKVHLDEKNEKIEKSTLRRNVTRYWQLSRGLGKFCGLSHEIEQELKQELEQMDNEFMQKGKIKTKIKEISDKYEYEH